MYQDFLLESHSSRSRLHEPFSVSHSVVIDGVLRGLRMPGDGPVGVLARGNLGIKSGQSYHLNHQVSASLDKSLSSYA